MRKGYSGSFSAEMRKEAISLGHRIPRQSNEYVIRIKKLPSVPSFGSSFG